MLEAATVNSTYENEYNKYRTWLWFICNFNIQTQMIFPIQKTTIVLLLLQFSESWQFCSSSVAEQQQQQHFSSADRALADLWHSEPRNCAPCLGAHAVQWSRGRWGSSLPGAPLPHGPAYQSQRRHHGSCSSAHAGDRVHSSGEGAENTDLSQGSCRVLKY